MSNKTSTDLVSSIIAGATAEVTILPICTIQTVYQTQSNLGAGHQSVWQVTKELYTRHGFRSFYNATGAGILSQMASTGSKFTIYKLIQKKRGTKKGDLWNNVLNGGAAGMASVLFTQPFDVLKNYHQRQKSIAPAVKEYGPQVFYHGAKQSITKSALLIACLYPVNDFFRANLSENPIISAIATTIAITPVIHPIDLLKRRAIAKKKLWLGWNPRPYYKGVLINWCRSIPHFCVTMWTIDFISKFF